MQYSNCKHIQKTKKKHNNIYNDSDSISRKKTYIDSKSSIKYKEDNSKYNNSIKSSIIDDNKDKIYNKKSYKYKTSTYNDDNDSNSDIIEDILNTSKESPYPNYSIISNIQNINNPQIIQNSQKSYYIISSSQLTPLPKRHSKTNEYAFSKATRAAILCRRIEYSYNLRGYVGYKVYIGNIIKIQRWWRRILNKRNTNILKDVLNNEIKRMNEIEKYSQFIKTIISVYLVYRLREFYRILKNKYGKLYNNNRITEKVLLIQRYIKPYLNKKREIYKKKAYIYIKFISHNMYRKRFFDDLRELKEKLWYIIKLQKFVKFYLLRTSESFYLYNAHKYHPLLYYVIKYNKDKRKNKKEKFLSYVNRWKFKYNKKYIENGFYILDNIYNNIRLKIYDYFFLKLKEYINMLLTCYLYIPLLEDILGIYNRCKLYNAFYIWKYNNKKIKRKEILAKIMLKKLLFFLVKKPIYMEIKRFANLNENN